MQSAQDAARILLVDDDWGSLDLFEAILELDGHRPEKVAAGRDALILARQDPPALIVLDVGMPEMDGFEICRGLKADARTAGVPVLFITGRDGLRDKERALAAGADDYITKPVEIVDLRTRVRSLLRVRHLNELDRALAYLQELESARRHLPAPPARLWERDASHVLLVDRDVARRQAYGAILREARFAVTAAATLAEAVAAAPRGADVLLLDLGSPDGSALDMLEGARRALADVPLIVLAAHPTADEAIGALRAGALDLLINGQDEGRLLPSVARAAKRRRLQRDTRRTTAGLEAHQSARPCPVEVAP